METKLERIADKSAHEPKPEFTSLYHLLNKELLMQCHRELGGSKAVGIDEVTKKEYGENLEQNIEGLVERLKRKSYKPQPSLRVYIPKSNGKHYKLLKERMEKFGLELEESKSRMLESGGYLAKSKQKRGESTRLETFDFLGFTFYCGQTRKGTAWMMPKTSSKKFRQKRKDIKVWLYANRDQKLKKLMGMLNLKLTGHYRYYGVSFNGRMISNFKQQVREMLFKVLNRRSNRESYTREGFIEMLKYYPLVMPKIYVSLF